MRLPYVNLRIVGISVLVVLLLAGGAGAWVWYNGRPDKLYESAVEHYHQGEKLRGADDPKKKPSDDDLAKAKADYERARSEIELFIHKAPKDSRLSQAHMLRYKILTQTSFLIEREAKVEKDAGKEREAANLQEEGFRSGQEALRVDNKNVEAQAVMLYNHFRHNDFRNAYPYARDLVDNLPADRKSIDLDGFDDYVIGAYYVLALKEVENNHPDTALKFLDQSLELEKPKPDGKRLPRWRAVALEISALQKKAEQAGKQAPPVRGPEDKLKDPQEKFKTQLAANIERARSELGQTVPAADGKPEMPLLATMSQTNTNGLFDVLMTGVVKGDSHAMVLERAELLLEVSEKLANTPDAKTHVYQDAVRGTSRLALLNASLPASRRLAPEELSKFQERAVVLNDVVLKNGGPIDPTAYLEMSQSAQKGPPPNRARALELARRGLKVAGDQRIAANDPRVLSLQAQAAWLLLFDHKVKEAEEFLGLISKQQQLSTDVAYMRGLGAVLDGRLEEGVRQLVIAKASPRYKENLPLLLGLAHGYMAQGQLDNALPVLEQLYVIRKREEGKNREDQFWVDLWQPTLTHASLSLFKCHLALARRALANPKDRAEVEAQERAAMQRWKELQGDFLAEDARAVLIDYKLARLTALEAKNPGGLQSELLQKDVQDLIASTPASGRNDPRLLWTEVRVILSQKETNPAAVAAAVAAPLGAATDLAVRLGEMGRLRAAFAWQWQRAEQRIMQAAAAQADSMMTQLTWVRWLRMNGRNEEALAKLSEMEHKATTDTDRRRLQAARAELLMASGKSGEAHDIIEGMRKEDPESTDATFLFVEEVLRGGDPEKAEKVIKEVVTKHDQSGLAHLLQGRVQQFNGEYAQAIQSYERSLQFAQFKGQSQNGIVACVLGVANGPPGKPGKANPEAAFAEVKRLRAAHPHDPVILITFAMTARLMDQVYGDDGMEGALAEMIRVLAEDKSTAPSGPYAAAQQWVAAGRPDRARQELKGNMAHMPSVALATQLAIADGDWAEVAAGLKAAEVLLPDAIDLPLWRAALHEARGEVSEAKELYSKFIEKNPKMPAGYLGLARLSENAAEYDKALEWLTKWRDKFPDDTNGLGALVRVLARAGKLTEANAVAEAYIKDQLKRARTAREEWEAKNPITEKDKEKEKEQVERRAREVAEGIAALDFTLTIGIVGAFQQAKAYAEAEKWLSGRGLPLIEKMAEATRAQNRLAFKSVRASLRMEQARQQKEKSSERARLMELAIQDYDEVLKERPDDQVVGNNLAWLLVKEKNQPDRALGLIEEVRKGRYSRKPISPERMHLEILDTLGAVYQAKGMNQEALELFKEAVQKRYRNEPRILMHLGLAYEAMGLKKDAYGTFREVIDQADARSKATTDPERKEQLAKLADEARGEQKKLKLGSPQ